MSHSMNTVNLTSDIHNNTMMGPYNIDSTYTVSTNNNIRTLTGSVINANGSCTTPALTVNQSGTIDLQGDNADIRVNGESLMTTLRGIQDHLNMLRPNPELEAEWDELRELGDQYRKLEAEFKEKSKMWNTLKK